MTSSRAPPVAAALVALACAGALALGDTPLTRAVASLELWTLDARFRLRGPEPPKSDVVLVQIDDATLRDAPEIAQLRTGFASLLVQIRAQGAKVIGVDAFFAEPSSPLPPPLTADVQSFVDDAARMAALEAGPALVDSGSLDDTPPAEHAGRVAASLLRRVRAEARGDEALEAALGDDVVLALHPRRDGSALDEAALRKARYGQIAPSSASSAGTPLEAAKLLASLPRFHAKAGALGLVTVELDDDQVGRRLAIARRHQGALVPPLAVHVAARMLDVALARVGYVPGEAVALGASRVPVSSGDAGDALLLNFRGPSGAFPSYSAVDVVRGTIPLDALRGRAVLVGFTYLSHDVSPTPFDGASPGLEVHATAVDNLVAGDPLRRSSPLFDALFALALGLAAAGLYTRAGPQRAALRVALSAALVALAGVVAYAAFARGVWLALALPVVGVVASSAAALVLGYATEGAERRRLRKAFAHYLADEIIDELMDNPAALALGGAKRDVTMLFSDIRGFTSLSEQRSPAELSRFLNAYLTPMTRAVLSERGFLDKYIGDALMAVFGAPAPSTDHPARALAAAVRMHAALLQLRASLDPSLSIGVGVNTGEVVAGNMGSAERFDYTVIGDAVNLASRLESLTKRYGVFCIVGDDTRRRVDADSFVFRELDLVRVKGRAQPVAIHELVPPTLSPSYVDVATFQRGVASWRAAAFDDARAAFTQFRAQNPHDAVAALYLARLDALAAQPSSSSAAWDGVFDHDEK